MSWYTTIWRNYITCSKRVRALESENKYLVERVEKLTTQLAQSITPIAIDSQLQNVIRARGLINNVRVVNADSRYCTFSLAEWRDILTRMYTELRSKENYKSSVFDCDDFALLFAGSLAYSAYKSSFDVQPAFAIAWSDLHAFNLFIDDRGDVYVYEPQNNRIYALNDAVNNSSYDITRVWFMG